MNLNIHVSNMVVMSLNFNENADLREDKRYLLDHPGLVPVTTEQVQ